MHRSIYAAVAAVAASLAVPALAAADTFCVNASPCAGSVQPGVQAALDAAKFHPGNDVVKVGASSQPYAGGFIYFESGTNNDVSIVGAGRGQTVFTSTSALPPLSLGQNSSVSHLTLRVSPNQAGATGLGLFGGIADDVEVIGQGVSADARGITTSDVSQIRTSAVRMSNGIGVLAENKDQDTDLDDSQVSARVGVLAKEGADLDVYRTKLYGTELGAGAEGEGSELERAPDDKRPQRYGRAGDRRRRGRPRVHDRLTLFADAVRPPRGAGDRGARRRVVRARGEELDDRRLCAEHPSLRSRHGQREAVRGAVELRRGHGGAR
jgi:hypothetical protein